MSQINFIWSRFLKHERQVYSSTGSKYVVVFRKLPIYLMSLLKLKSICHNTRSQSLLSLEIPLTQTNIGKIACKFFASHKWTTVQVELKLTKYLSVNQFKSLLDNKDVPQCCCFKLFSDFFFTLCYFIYLFFILNF